jgi:ABC-2 type transport system ATP-binding protein
LRTVTVAVETVGLAKRYPTAEALKGVSLRIEAGEIFALLGPNGAGKTTWIGCVCGLIKPTAGSARVLGFDVASQSMQARRQLGLVPQELNFDPFFSPRETLRFQMGYYGLRPDDAHLLSVLQALGLRDKADVNARELSGGMKRRLLIAKALVAGPKVLFLDEPTAGVDVALRRELWTYVRKLRSQGTTIVLTTHYLEEAQSLADRVAVIDHGELITVDSPAQLMRRHGRKRVQITLRAQVQALPPELRRLGAELDANGRILTCAPEEGDLPALLDEASRLGIADLRTEEPSLEQVFLELTEGSRAG